MKRIVLLVAMMASLLVLPGCGRSNEQISTDVKPVVANIIKKNLGVEAACTRLLDIQKVDRNHYTATAEVELYTLQFGIKTKSTEMIKVSIAYDGDTVLVKIEK